MNMEKDNSSINVNVIIRIIYKNILLISLTTLMITVLAGFFAFKSKAYKSEIILYGNDRVLNEIGENSQYSLNSFEFFKYLQNNTKVLKNKDLENEKFVSEMSKRLTAQSENGNPSIKVNFSTKSKFEAEQFSKEYAEIAQQYLTDKKNTFLDKQLKLLEEQYNFLNSNIELRTTKDSLSDTLVSRLSYYRLLKNDTTPVVRLVSISTKPALNKKVVLAGGFLFGVFLGIFIAFIKEFSKTLDWKDIKK